MVGGGASGLLVAARLLDASFARPVRVRIYDPSPGLGRGVAYGTEDPGHLLNVRSSGMTADPSRPDDFADWARARLGAGRDDFVPRRAFRSYLVDHLDEAACRAASGAADHERAVVSTVRSDGTAWLLGLNGGAPVRADAVVLATGNPAPGVPAALRPLAGRPGWVPDPWAPGALAGLAGRRRVMCIGTGLTMVDVVLTATRDPGVEVVAVSRRGELPRRHTTTQPQLSVPVVTSGDERLSLDDVVARIDDAVAAGHDWRDVIDSVRPWANSVWQHLDDDDRQRFLDGSARQWDVHRHRMAPGPAAEIAALRHAGRLRVLAATPERVAAGDGVFRVELCGVDGSGSAVEVDAVVNCTGPGRPWEPPANPAVADLVATGAARPHRLGLGLDTSPDGHLIDRSGRVVPDLMVIGPPRRGTLWETTAVPEIRSQALHVADRLLVAG